MESPATKIFRLIWVLMDCCHGDLIVGFLCIDIVAALKWEVYQLVYRRQNVDLMFHLRFE